MVPLQSDADFQVLLLGFLRGGQHLADARRVGRHRLFHEDVLAGRDRRLKMDRPKTGRRRQDHHVGFCCQRLLIRVEPGEDVIVLHVYQPRMSVLQIFQGPLGVVLKRVGNRDQLNGAAGAQRLPGGSASASAAADQRDLDRIIPGGINGTGEQASRDRRGGHDSRGTLEKITSRLIQLRHDTPGVGVPMSLLDDSLDFRLRLV